MRPVFRLMLVLLASAVGAGAGGCHSSTPRSAEFGVTPDRYAHAIDTTRDVLLEARFELDRVDAASGIITTQPKASAGLATLWDADQTTLGQEISDATSTQRRRVRVTFEPAAVADRTQAAGQAGGPAAPLDLRSATAPLTARVEVFVDRVHRPGTRLETESIRTSTTTVDPELTARRMSPEYVTTVDRDDLLAGRLAERIRERLAGS